MIDRKFLFAAPAVLALALAGCGPSERQKTAASYCPTPFGVQDAQSLTRFRPGSGHDPRDVVFEAALTDSNSSCSLGKGQMVINLTLRVAVNAGPAVTSGVSSVPYFVRVIDPGGAIVQGQEFNADFHLSSSSPRGQSQEELTLRIPFSQASEIASYRIAVGLKPTPEELDYNRRATAHP